MMLQINYPAIRSVRVMQIALAAAASILVSILIAVIFPVVADSHESHLLFAVALGTLGLILPFFRSRVVRIDAGLVFVFCCFEPMGRILLHQEAPPPYYIFALVLVLTIAYFRRSNAGPGARNRGES